MNAHDKVNILLVDDQPAKLLSLEVILGELGENLITASSARAALEHLLKTDFAVILVDVCMPELDGFELAAMIRDHPRFQQTPIIFISAIHLTDIDRLRGYECGAVDYVPVPVVPEILRAKVKIFVELYRKTRQLEQLNSELEQRVAERTASLEASTARLRESEQRRSLALAAGRMGSWDWNPGTDEWLWDEGQSRIFGVDPDGVASRQESAWVFVHPEDRERLKRMAAQAAETGCAFDAEFRIIRPNGEVRWCVAGAAPTVDAAGRAIRMGGVTLDITERKRVEEALRASEGHLRLALSAAEAGTWDWDIVTGAIVWSPENYGLYGVDPAKAPLTDEDRGCCIHPDDRERADRDIRDVVEGRVSEFRSEFRVIHPSFGERWILSLGRVERNGIGRPVRMSGINLDITDRKVAEGRLKLLAAEVDHRSKNLLAIVQVMLRQTRAGDAKEFAKMALGRVAALARVHALLAESRWESAELSRLVGEEFAPFTRSERNQIQVHGPRVALAPAAAQSLAMALHELVTNAAKYGALSAPAGRVKVCWSLQPDGGLGLSWREMNGPPVTGPAHRGLGTAVIERTIQDQLRGEVRLEWHPSGLRCQISLPIGELVRTTQEGAKPQAAARRIQASA